MRCLNKQPDQRFQDIDALDAALSGCDDAGGWTQSEAAAWWTENRPEARPPADAPGPDSAPTHSVIVSPTQMLRREG